MGLKEKFKSARETSEKISSGILEPQHLGKHNLESVGAELFSLQNERPMFRDKKWRQRLQSIKEVCLNKIAKGDSHFQNSLIQLKIIEEMR